MILFLLSIPSLCAALFSNVSDSWAILQLLTMIGRSIKSLRSKQILCRMQQAIIYFGIKFVLCIGSVSKILQKRPFSRPIDRSTIILAQERRLFKLTCLSDKWPLSLNGIITYFVRQYAASPNIWLSRRKYASVHMFLIFDNLKTRMSCTEPTCPA